MRIKFLFPALVALAFAACGSEPAVDAAPRMEDGAAIELTETEVAEHGALSRCGVVSAEGYCGVRFGMTPEAAAAAFPVKLESYESTPGAEDDPLACHELFAAEPVTGISMLAENNAVGRIDFISITARTAEGFGVGSSAAAIRAKFASVVSEKPNIYEPEITDISVVQGATKYIFEIENDAVRSWRVGVAPTIDYPAHCG
jgi:hypothetical protein